MFNHALYYPSIEVKDENWLKSAVLFWETIETIVPESIEHPYKRRTSLALENHGILRPRRVNPFCREVNGLGRDVVEYLKHRRGGVNFMRPSNRINHYLNREYYGEERLRRRLEEEYQDFYLHAQKLPVILRDELKGLVNEDGFVWAPREFLNYYMTLLANRICQINDLALLTDKVTLNALSNTVNANGLALVDSDTQPRQIESGFLYKAIMEGINVDPDTSIEKIIRFKSRRIDELNRFREEIDRLLGFHEEGMSLFDMENAASEILSGKILPAMDDIKRSLTAERIEWGVGKISEYIFGGIIPAAITSELGGKKLLAVAASLGGAFAISAVNYVRSNRRQEQKEPYTYLLKARRAFGNNRG